MWIATTSTPFATSWRDVIWNYGRYQLEYRVRSPEDSPDTGWYLYGPEGRPFGQFIDRYLKVAKSEAERYISSV